MDDTLHSEVQIDGRVEEILKELKFVYDIGDGVVIDLNEKIPDDKYDDLVGFINSNERLVHTNSKTEKLHLVFYRQVSTVFSSNFKLQEATINDIRDQNKDSFNFAIEADVIPIAPNDPQ